MVTWRNKYHLQCGESLDQEAGYILYFLLHYIPPLKRLHEEISPAAYLGIIIILYFQSRPSLASWIPRAELANLYIKLWRPSRATIYLLSLEAITFILFAR